MLRYHFQENFKNFRFALKQEHFDDFVKIIILIVRANNRCGEITYYYYYYFKGC